MCLQQPLRSYTTTKKNDCLRLEWCKKNRATNVQQEKKIMC